MTYILIWILLGSIGLNLMWALKFHKNWRVKELLKGFLIGCAIGPFCIIVFINKVIKVINENRK